MAKFRTLFSVRFLHNYYANNNCEELTVESTSETNGLMANASIVMKKTPSGFNFLIDENKLDVLEAYYKDDNNLSLDFRIISGNSSFKNYTEIDASKILLLTNKNENIVENEIRLSKSNYVSVEDGYETGADELNGLLSVNDRFLKPLGFLRVYVMNLFEGNTITTKNYSIAFNARSVYLYFYIAQNRMSNGATYKIEDTSKKFTFSDAIETKLTNGAEAILIKSNDTIPLRAKANYPFQLLYGSQKLIKKLPAASYQPLYKEKSSNTNLYYSKIFI